MAAPSTSAPAVPRRPRRRVGRGTVIGIGLVFTFVGIALLVLLLPSSPSGYLLGVSAGIFLSLWVGGILLGRARSVS